MGFMGFPCGSVVKNPPSNTGDTGSTPDSGRSHMPRSNKAHVSQLLSLRSRAREPQLPSVRQRAREPQLPSLRSRAREPQPLSLRSRAREPQLLSARAREPELHKRSHRSNKSMYSSSRAAPACLD